MLSCIILAGGESKRFGEDKVFFKLDGFSFLERAVTTAAEVSGDIVICGREKNKTVGYYEEAEKALKNRKDLMPEIIADDKNCGLTGPARGIYSSLKALKGEYVMVMECDAPFFSAAPIKEMLKKAKSERAKAVVPLWPDSTVEPLLACYKRKDVLSVLEILNNYALNLGENFLFNDAVNILRLLPSVYYYGVLDMARDNPDIKAVNFINMNSKRDVEKYAGNKTIIAGNKSALKSLKIKKANKFFDLKRPAGGPRGVMAKALYYWWVYAKTGNYIYLKKSLEYFGKDSLLYRNGGLDFMGEKIMKILPALPDMLKKARI